MTTQRPEQLWRFPVGDGFGLTQCCRTGAHPSTRTAPLQQMCTENLTMWQSPCYILSRDIFSKKTHMVLAHTEFKPSYIFPHCFQAQAFCLDIQSATPLHGPDPVGSWYTSSQGIEGDGKEEALIYKTCQFPWCKYSHCRWFQATKGLTTCWKNSWILNHWFS